VNRDMCKFESSQKDESRWQSTDSSKAYRSTSAFKCQDHCSVVCGKLFRISLKCPLFRIWSYEYLFLNGICVTSACDSWKYLSVIVMLKMSSSVSMS